MTPWQNKQSLHLSSSSPQNTHNARRKSLFQTNPNNVHFLQQSFILVYSIYIHQHKSFLSFSTPPPPLPPFLALFSFHVQQKQQHLTTDAWTTLYRILVTYKTRVFFIWICQDVSMLEMMIIQFHRCFKYRF